MVIAFVNLRFVIRGALEDEVREIGTLKAIGLSRRSIAGLYLAKYRLIAVVSCLIGGAVAPFTAELLLSGIQANYGSSPAGLASVIVPLAALGLVYLVITALCHGILRRIGRIDTVRALVHGSTLTERGVARRARREARRARRSRLDSGALPVTTRLSLRELRAEWRRWALLPFVFALATVLVTVPTNLLTTLEDPRFVTYMGAPDSDLRSDLQFGDDLDTAHRQLISTMEDDSRLTAVRSFTRILADVRVAGATADVEAWRSLPVEVGDYADTPLEFLTGTRPDQGQIALSALAADEHGVSTGDRLDLRRVSTSGTERRTVEVSGIYQDVTSGGRTAKLHDPGHALAAASGASAFVVYADVTGDADPVALAADYNRRLPEATTVPMREYVQQTLSFATTSLRGASVVAFGFGTVVVALITALFLTLFLARERKPLGILHTLGFSTAEITRGIRGKTAVVIGVGVLVGMAVSAALGDTAITTVLSGLGLGIAHLTLTPDPWLAWVAYPLALGTAGALSTIAATRRLPGITGASWLR
ncbi:FtsX-like permease family protein [Homoserinibacter sp. YIM 151385]|uniref:FtsX-like permease family protein n=1 Tax=Homoserinibacter sp. YIM 151385 TaxID=2985506 RepID=UPI0022F01BAC|nr:ABC transporter permease [Homoserinibacter sp. YIM 151385]WBU39349.1 ABC transporter permease [Homoserinibacter sp. YIM 151385]